MYCTCCCTTDERYQDEEWEIWRVGLWKDGRIAHDSETLHMDENSIWIDLYAEKRGKRESCERGRKRERERA